MEPKLNIGLHIARVVKSPGVPIILSSLGPSIDKPVIGGGDTTIELFSGNGLSPSSLSLLLPQSFYVPGIEGLNF